MRQYVEASIVYFKDAICRMTAMLNCTMYVAMLEDDLPETAMLEDELPETALLEDDLPEMAMFKDDLPETAMLEK